MISSLAQLITTYVLLGKAGKGFIDGENAEVEKHRKAKEEKRRSKRTR